MDILVCIRKRTEVPEWGPWNRRGYKALRQLFMLFDDFTSDQSPEYQYDIFIEI